MLQTGVAASRLTAAERSSDSEHNITQEKSKGKEEEGKEDGCVSELQKREKFRDCM